MLIAARPASDAAELETTLTSSLERAQRAWPGVVLAPELFVAHLAARLPDDADLSHALAKLHTDDLYLACACARGVREALAVFDRQYLSRLPAEVLRIDRSDDFTDDVRQRLRERLLLGSPPRIAEYTGRGALGAWVRVTAVRTALNARRDAQRRDNLRAPSPPPAPTPEGLAIYGQYREEVEAALKIAFARLGADSRELLRQHFVEGLNFEQIARLRTLDRSSVSRRVAAARQFLSTESLRELRRRLPGLTSSSLDSLLHGLRSNLEITLSSAFKQG
jgi:RNA polymerase sigma-70 factor (ECF subfamily)